MLYQCFSYYDCKVYSADVDNELLSFFIKFNFIILFRVHLLIHRSGQFLLT